MKGETNSAFSDRDLLRETMGRVLSTTVLLLLAVADALGAQVDVATLDSPNWTITRGFTEITGVRELADGRLIVSDREENTLYVVDWDDDEVRSVARRGQGPREFRRIGRLYSTWENGTLLTDAISSRWLVLDGSDVVRTLVSRRPANQLLGPILHGIDQRGRMLDTKGVAWHPGVPITVDSNADSMAVLLVTGGLDEEGSVSIDTIARIAAAGSNTSSVGVCAVASGAVARSGGGQPAGTRASCRRNPIIAPDQVLLFPDGWVAVAHVRPYRVDWRDDSGRWIRGNPIPHAGMQMTTEAQCAAVQEFAFRGIEVACDEEEISGIQWQDSLPPIMLPWDAMAGSDKLPAIFAAPDGSLLLRRTPKPRDLRNFYDLVDRGGQLVRRIVLPANEAVVGFGSSSIYTIQIDRLDLQWLRRHPWP